MKKSLLIFSVVLLIAGLFISCNSEAAGSEEDLVYVSFADEGKALSSSVSPEMMDSVNGLYWYYKAAPDFTSSLFAIRGTKTEWTRVNNTTGLAGSIGPFTKGPWKFELVGSTSAVAPINTSFNGTEWTVGDDSVRYYGVSGSVYNTKTSVNIIGAQNKPTTIPVSLKYKSSAIENHFTLVFHDITLINHEDLNDNQTVWYKVCNGSNVVKTGSVTTLNHKAEIPSDVTVSDVSGTSGTAMTLTVGVYSDGEFNELLQSDTVSFVPLTGSTVTITGTLPDLIIDYGYGEFDLYYTNTVENAEAYVYNGSTATQYATLSEAITAANAGETVGLLKDVGSAQEPKTSVYTITKSLTIDGNNHRLYVGTSSSSDSAINITASNVSVSLNYIDIYSTTMERAVQIGKQDGSSVANVVLNINHSELHANTNGGNTYTLNVRPGTVNAHININESTIEGSAAMNIWGTGHAISVNNSTLTGNNKMTHSSTRGYAGNDFGVVVFEGGSSSSYATSVNVNLTNCILNASSENQNAEDLILFNPYSSGNGVTITDCTMTYDTAANQDTEVNHWISALSYTNNNTVSVSGGSLNSSTPSIVAINNGTNNSFTVSNQ